jgi:hypothetical protein
MRSRKWFTASAVFLLIGLISPWSKWNGSAGINAGYPVTQWAVSFNGSIHGWPAMIGVLSLFLAIVFFVWAVPAIALGSQRRDS